MSPENSVMPYLLLLLLLGASKFNQRLCGQSMAGSSLGHGNINTRSSLYMLQLIHELYLMRFLWYKRCIETYLNTSFQQAEDIAGMPFGKVLHSNIVGVSYEPVELGLCEKFRNLSTLSSWLLTSLCGSCVSELRILTTFDMPDLPEIDRRSVSAYLALCLDHVATLQSSFWRYTWGQL